jgi:hypothetical protein
MSLREPSADASATADDAAASAADCTDGSSWAVVKAAMPTTMAVEKRIMLSVWCW